MLISFPFPATNLPLWVSVFNLTSKFCHGEQSPAIFSWLIHSLKFISSSKGLFISSFSDVLPTIVTYALKKNDFIFPYILLWFCSNFNLYILWLRVVFSWFHWKWDLLFFDCFCCFFFTLAWQWELKKQCLSLFNLSRILTIII